MATGEDAIKALWAIENKLSRIIALIEPLVASLPKPVADDSDLDSQYGDEQIKFLPRNWLGTDYKGRRMSETEPRFLDQLASAFDYFAEQNDAKGVVTDKGVPKSTYDKRAAARARGWSKRLANGWKSPHAAVDAAGAFGDADPFGAPAASAPDDLAF